MTLQPQTHHGLRVDDIEARLAGSDSARWLLPPVGGFAFVAGPSDETIELFDSEVSA